MAVKVNGRYISVSINSEYIKLCEATKGAKNTTVHKIVTVGTPEGVYSDGDILDVKELAKVIKSALDDNRMNSNDVVFTISSNKIATKDVLVPDVKGNKIDKIIETNAAEYFPVKIEDYIVQYYPLEKVEEEGTSKLKVVVVAAPAKIIEKYYELAKDMGLKVAYIDYAGNSVYQLVKQQIDKSTSIVISIEEDTTLVSIFKNGDMQLQRSVHYGKSLMVNTVMNMYKLDYARALSKLQTEYLLGKSVDSNEITESVRPLISNISRITDYYVSRNNTPIEKIYVIGNATTIRGFNKLMSNEFNMEIVPIESLDGVLTDKRTYVDESSLTSYTAAIGALIAPVNFVSLTKIEEDKRKDSGKSMAFIVVAAVAASLLLVLVPGVQLIFSNIQVAALKNDVKKLEPIENIVNEYYQAKDENTDVKTFKTQASNNNDSVDTFVSQLESKVPSDVVITSMSVTSGNVAISGTASSKSSLGMLVLQLQSIPTVSNVVVSNETENRDNTGTIQLSFSLSCSFGDIKGALQGGNK